MRSFHDRFGWLGSVLDILTFLPCTFSCGGPAEPG